MIHVFDFRDYKDYLKALEAQRAPVQRGFRTRLAESLDCQNAYISQILNGSANLSPEQGLKIAAFLSLNEDEARYFVILIEYARAGTRELKEFHRRDLDVLREKFLNVEKRVAAHALSLESQSVYYSGWLYMTVHMIATIPTYQTIAKISAALGASEEAVQEVVLFLLETELLSEKNGRLLPGPTQLHLSKDSPYVRQHYTNWRVASIQKLTEKDPRGLHYSAVSSLSISDAEKIRSKLIQVIQEYVETIRPSKEETLYNFNLDFYSLIRK